MVEGTCLVAGHLSALFRPREPAGAPGFLLMAIRAQL